MARIRRYPRAITSAVLGLLALAIAPALAQDQGPNAGTDLYDRPVLAIDPGMHTAKIQAQSVDAAGRFAVTGSADRTVRVWSVADGKLLRTIWIPVGPENVGRVYAVAISPNGSTIAVGGWTERLEGDHPIYLFDRESGNLIQRIRGDLPNVTSFLTFSPDGRYLAATLGSRDGLRVFDRDKDWSEAFRDDQYGDLSYGAAFAPNGRLATTAYDGMIRVYAYNTDIDSPNFRRIGELAKAASGHRPRGIAFSPDGKRLAVGYNDVAAADILDGKTLNRLSTQRPADATPNPIGLTEVAWSRDGQTLLGAGGARDGQGRVPIFAWDRGGLGTERRLPYCADTTATAVDALADDRILVASSTPCLGLVGVNGESIWTVQSPILDFRGQADVLKLSQDGNVVDFDFLGSAGAVFRFDTRSLSLSTQAPNNVATFAPNREGLVVDGWRNGFNPTLNGRELPFANYDIARSLAIAPDAKRFFIGTSFGLTAFDDSGTRKWHRDSRGEVWAINASKDGRVVVAAEGDGTIRWHRADDGRELLALQVFSNKKDWVLWTPEGFYAATPGAEDTLKWVTNHGTAKAATTLPISAIPRLHRPDALPHVLEELATQRALGIADIASARLAVQKATGSARSPGATLRVLAIGINYFGDHARGLHLDYAVDDARDFGNALLRQTSTADRPTLYADVKLTVLQNDKANRVSILQAMDEIAQDIRQNGSDQDVSMILISSHSVIIAGELYLIPYGFDITNQQSMEATAISVTEFTRRVENLAAKGERVLLLFDTSRDGAIGPGASSAVLDANVLQNAINMDNVSVLTSSRKDEVSLELPMWGHSAFAKAFLDALSGAADREGRGVISINDLATAMNDSLVALTGGRQHIGLHVNFLSDLFVVPNSAETRQPIPAQPSNAKLPGVLHVLAIGINDFGRLAGKLHLDYAVDDAHDVAASLLNQKGATGKAILYSNVVPLFLHDEAAGRIDILKAMDNMAQNMRATTSEQDVAVILFSGHGEVIDGKYYLIPYGVDVADKTTIETTSIWVEEFADRVQSLAAKGKVLLLLDACHSGAVGPGGQLDASVLRKAVNMDNVAVLTSSEKDELSQELPKWKHGAFTKAFLDALAGGALPDDQGRISTSSLEQAMKKELESLTGGGQHLSIRMNFDENIFVLSN